MTWHEPPPVPPMPPAPPPQKRRGFSGPGLWGFLALQAIWAILTAIVVGQEAAQAEPFGNPGGAFLGFLIFWAIADAIYLGAWAAVRSIRRG